MGDVPPTERPTEEQPADVRIDRADTDQVIAVVLRNAYLARPVLTWAGFQPTPQPDTLALPRETSLEDARHRVTRACHILWARGLETLVDSYLDDGASHMENLQAAVLAVDALTRDIDQMWHPEEVAWHLHQLATPADSLLAAVRRTLDRAEQWCTQAGIPAAATELHLSQAALSLAQDRLGNVTSLLHQHANVHRQAPPHRPVLPPPPPHRPDSPPRPPSR